MYREGEKEEEGVLDDRPVAGLITKPLTFKGLHFKLGFPGPRRVL